MFAVEKYIIVEKADIMNVDNEFFRLNQSEVFRHAYFIIHVDRNIGFIEVGSLPFFSRDRQIGGEHFESGQGQGDKSAAALGEVRYVEAQNQFFAVKLLSLISACGAMEAAYFSKNCFSVCGVNPANCSRNFSR